MSKLNRPDSPLLSPIYRFLGKSVMYLAAAIFLSGSLPFILIFLLAHQGNFISGIWQHISSMCVAYLVGTFLGSLCALPFVLSIIPRWERGKGLGDVGKVVKEFAKYKRYVPLEFINVTKGCFVGKNKNKPIFIPWRKIRETHIQILGTTGSGKGIIMSLIAYQCALQSGSVIWIDPKLDRFAPRILRDAAKQAGKPFYYIDLNPHQPAQINILKGSDRFEIEELFVAGFDLRSKGTDADFHRGKDEDAAILAAKIAADNGITSFRELRHACQSIKSITDQENFWRNLGKLADLQSINTDSGIDLRDATNNSVFYIVGSSDNERVKTLQKMILVRIMQLIKKRDRFYNNPPVCIVLDEFKHLLSFTALNALGTVRDFNAHFILAHQSLSDLKDCQGIEPEAAFGEVVDNTSIKIIYRISDADFAERMAKSCGQKRTFVESVSSSVKNDKNEGMSNGWREDQTYLIHPDLISHLPIPSDHKDQAAVGILYGVGPAKVFHVGPIPTQGPMPQVVAAAPSSTSREELI